MFNVSYDSLFTVRTDADDGDGCLELCLEELDVVRELLGELVLRSELRHVGLPTGQLYIYRFDTLLDVVGEVACLYTVHLIRSAGLDGVEATGHESSCLSHRRALWGKDRHQHGCSKPS